MQDGKFQKQPSLFLTKSNEGRQISKLIETKDCKNMILTIFRLKVPKKSNNLTILVGWNRVHAGIFFKN